MSHGYRPVQWTAYKWRYDAILLCVILLYIGAFFAISKLTRSADRQLSDEVLLIRATSTCAFMLLSFILCIGPLARLDRRFLPVLYNRRHLGVATFFVALVHAAVVLGFYHGFGNLSPLRSLLVSNTQYGSIIAFPFEMLGVLALIILFLMAATSHDFWLKNLTPAVWKWLHMMVYVAWTLLVFHVALGVLQSERNWFYVLMLGVSVVSVCGLHFAAGAREVKFDREAKREDWIDAGTIDEIPDQRAKVISVAGAERIALYRNGEKLSALSNVCAHQGGPLGEGKIIDGCVTCPWHGFTYRAEDGCAPPPFTERVATHAVRVENGRVMVCTEERYAER